MKNDRKRSKKFVFMQYLNPKYWDWESDKITWFDDWEKNKTKIFEEIYNSVKNMQGFEEIALIVHDKDEKRNGILKLPHIHGYIAYKERFDLDRIARRLGIEPQDVEIAKGNRYAELNNKSYLIHAKNLDKYQYLSSEVETFGTSDFIAYIDENMEDLQKRASTTKREQLEEGFDLVRQSLLTGKLKRDDLMDDENLRLLYGMNQTAFNESMAFYGLSLGHERLKKLKNQEYKLTVLYIQALPGVGKTQLTDLLATKLKTYGLDNGFESEVYSASSSNPFDEYLGEDILILDDLRVKSLSVSDWLKLFDPLNTARMSARYRNKVVVPRVIIVANYKTPVDFFKELKGEDLDQFVRRIGNFVEINSKQFPLGDNDHIYNVSEVFRRDNPKVLQISEDEIVTLNFDYQKIFSENGKRESVADRLINEIIVPRSFPRVERIKDVS